MTTIAIVWPEKRLVPVQRIRTWFNDALANGELELESAEAAQAAKSFWLMAKCLDAAGLITLRRPT